MSTVTVLNPATEKPLAELPEAGLEEADAAVARAGAAFPAWRAVSPSDVSAKWEEGWDVLFQALSTLSDADLSRTVTIRGQALSVLDALQRSVTHASYHVGQIVFLARSLRGKRWEWLTIPPGQSDEYNRSPKREKP